MAPEDIEEYHAVLAESDKLQTICQQHGDGLSIAAYVAPLAGGAAYAVAMWPQMNAMYGFCAVTVAMSGFASLLPVICLEDGTYKRMQMVRQTACKAGRMDRDAATRLLQRGQVAAFAKGMAVMLGAAAVMHGCGMAEQAQAHKPAAHKPAVGALNR